MMKILLVSQDNSNQVKLGGKHIHQRLLSDEWINNHHDVRCAFPSSNSLKTTIFKRIIFRLTRGFTNYPVKYFKDYISLIEEKTYLAILEQLQNWIPDVVTAQDPLSVLACRRAFDKLGISNIKITLTLHGYYTWEMFNYGYYGNHNKSKIEEFGFEIERKAFKYINSVITVDTRIKNYLINELDFKGKIEVIFNSIDLGPYSSLSRQRKFPPAHWNILITRRMVLKNGVIVAVRAMELIKQSRSNFTLTIIGDGPEFDNINREIERFGLDSFIKIIGPLDHELISNYYINSHILLMPSIPSDNIEEATSLSMLEGMASGNIVICSEIGGMKEIIKNGQTGFLVQPNSPDLLAEAIKKVMQLDAVELLTISKNAIDFTFENHSSAYHSKRILNQMQF